MIKCLYSSCEKSGVLYTEYREYSSRTGKFTRSNVDFTAALLQEGFEKKRVSSTTYIVGIKIKN